MAIVMMKEATAQTPVSIGLITIPLRLHSAVSTLDNKRIWPIGSTFYLQNKSIPRLITAPHFTSSIAFWVQFREQSESESGLRKDN